MLQHFRSLLLVGLAIVIACAIVVVDPWLNAAQHSVAQPAPQTSKETTAVQQVALQFLNTSSRVPAKIRRTAISGDFALVSWNQGEAGGTALLKKKDAAWQVVASGGGRIGVQDMVQKGVPQVTAEALLTQLDPDWRKYEVQ